MFETQIIHENKKPRFVVIDYKLYEKFYDLIEKLEDAEDSRLNPATLGPRVPFEIVEAICDGKSPVEVWREYRHLTQKQLADKLGVTQAAVSMFENPKSNPRQSTLKKIAKALHCSAELLMRV